MVHTIQARNVNDALISALWRLRVGGRMFKATSRNGEVLVFDAPVVTTYMHPQERVLFSSERDANPFFHLMEALWMLAGRDDLAFPHYFNSKFDRFSDDGKTIYGAYGWRWRGGFGFDQLGAIATLLRAEPTSRRAVLTMWSPVKDLHCGLKKADIPCNTTAYFQVIDGALNMTVCCRSNDILWGAYGANAVHFSVLQEYMAAAIGVGIGPYVQFSNNLHIYTDILDPINDAPRMDRLLFAPDPYALGWVMPSSLISTSVQEWDQDLSRFMSDPAGDCAYVDPFFNDVVAPMYSAWRDRKLRLNSGRPAAQAIAATDWRRACLDWINRREKFHEDS